MPDAPFLKPATAEFRFISSRYDPERKRSVKVTGKLLGRITKDDGFIESEKRKLTHVKEVSHYEYGVSQFILNQSVYLKRLEQHFPDDWKASVLAAYARLTRQAPIKEDGRLYESKLAL